MVFVVVAMMLAAPPDGRSPADTPLSKRRPSAMSRGKRRAIEVLTADWLELAVSR
jgi:hypothetical protein